jgi:hypothetical protein
LPVQCCGCPVLGREEPITSRELWLTGTRSRHVAGLGGSVSIRCRRGTRRGLQTVECCGCAVFGGEQSVPCRSSRLTGTRGRRVAGRGSLVTSQGRIVPGLGSPC